MKKRILLFLFSTLLSHNALVAQVVSTLAGSANTGYADGTGADASFNYPMGVAVDGIGNVYVADTENNRIRMITSSGVVTTLAGSGNAAYADGIGADASFNFPHGVAVDGAGNVYVADYLNNRIRMITSSGVVTTLAGSGTAGYADGTGADASFNYPMGVAVDGIGNVYVADTENNRIRMITSSGVVTTLAGSGNAAYADGAGANASFDFPHGVALDGAGNVYVADYLNNRIRIITSSGVVTTLAGSGNADYTDGIGTDASFRYPMGVAIDGIGNVYVADTENNRIRTITSSGVVTTLAGSGTAGYADGAGTDASFNFPHGVAVDKEGNVYVADYLNNRIRSIAVPLSTGIEESVSVINGTIYPNPAKNEVTVTLPYAMRNMDSYTVTLFDISGKSIELSFYEVSSDALKLTIAGIQKGMYQIAISTGSGNMINKLVITE